MKKLLYLAALALLGLAAACSKEEPAIEKYQVDYYPEIKGIKIAEAKAEDDFASTSERVLFYNNPHTTYLLDMADSGEYNVSVDLTVIAHCVSANGQGACLYIRPRICLYTVDSTYVSDSIYVDDNLSDSIYVNNALYVRDSIYSSGNLYVNSKWNVNTLKKELYAGKTMAATTLVAVDEITDVKAVTISKSVVHAVDEQHVSVSENVLVPKHGAAHVAFEVASDTHTAQCYASNVAGGVGYAVIYIEPTNDKMASAQMLFQN
jgi:hypothetical protein